MNSPSVGTSDHVINPWFLALATVAACVGGTITMTLIRYNRHNRYVGDIPGPVDSASWLYGNLPELLLTRPYGKFEFQWLQKYGPTHRLKGCLSEDLLFTSDPTALRFILNSDKLFDLSDNRAFMLSVTFGKNSMAAVRNGGDTHRRIKNSFAPAFSAARLQSHTPAVKNIASKVSDKLMQQYMENGEQTVTIDIYQLIQHLTSDVIGEVGFGYKFNAVETGGGDKVARSHQNVVMLAGKRSKGAIFGESVIAYLPRMILGPMLHLPVGTLKALLNFRNISETWAAALLADSRQSEGNTDTAGLFGLVASANESQKRERLSIDEIIQQAAALLVGGQDTTANVLAWALYELAKRPAWQDKVRKEIEARNTESSRDKLEYLNAHIKEILRFHPAVALSERVAYADTVIPLSRPMTMTSRRVITELPVRKGQTIYIGIASYNRNPDIWGPDANVFDPLRWIDGRYNSTGLPGIGPYSNLASFSGGSRVCVGWRLAIFELQIVLSELISKFRFSFTTQQTNDITSTFALTLLPLDVRSGKPSLSVQVQPVHDQDY